MKKRTIEYSLDDIPSIVQNLKKLLKKYPIMTFTGSLGAGKTTLVRALLHACGVKDRITSPTFTYVHRYENDRGHTFYHFDLYRIQNLNDFCATGFDEYLYAPNSSVFIEWPEHIMPLLKERVCHIRLDYHDNPTRRSMVIECLQ